MRFIGVDSETVAFSPGDAAPALVCIQYAEANQPPALASRARGALCLVESWLRDQDVTLVGHNLAYDAAVWCREGLTRAVFQAYAEGRMVCTWAFERLGEIAGYSARKKLDLVTCAKAHGVVVDGLKGLDAATAKALATSFGQFLWAEEIPEPWRSYALGDCAVLKLFERQFKRFRDVPWRALQLYSRKHFWLQLQSVWGLPTNGDLVEAFSRDSAAQLANLRAAAQGSDWGGLIRPDGTRNMAAIRARVESAYAEADRDLQRTPGGSASTSEQTLAESADPVLEAFAPYAKLVKVESTDVPMLRAGVLHPRYGIADTGRTTCSKPNVQNLPGRGQVRSCIVPRPGWCFLERDYSGIELCTFAQTCVTKLGRRNMADVINRSGDPGHLHAVVGGLIAGCSPEELLRRRAAGDELADNARTRAKNGNFGFMGGLGHRKFVDYVRLLSRGKLLLTEAEALGIKQAWAAGTGGDGPAYLKYVGGLERTDGTFDVESIGPSGLVRRGVWYCAAANFPFQNLAAEIAAEAGWRLACAEYLPGGALFGHTRSALFVHDSFVLETPTESVHDVDSIFDRILREAAEAVMPDVLTRSEGFAAFSLAKGKRVLDSTKRLVPWKPKEPN